MDIAHAQNVGVNMADFEKINYIDKGLKKYEVDILTLGLCDIFFRASFVEEKSKVKGIFDCRGYEKLSDVEKISAETGFHLFASMAKNALQAEKHCMFSENFEMREENCFVDLEKVDMKFLYLRDNGKKNFKDKMLKLMCVVLEKVDVNERDLFQRAMDVVGNSKGGFKPMIGHIEALEREALQDLRK